MATVYPAQTDTSLTLPTAIDSVTPVSAAVVNILRDAILAIEAELGAKPSGIYGTVRTRLDTLEALINSGGGGGGGSVVFGGDLIGNSVHQVVVGLQSIPLSSTAPTQSAVPIFDTSASKYDIRKLTQDDVAAGIAINSFTGGSTVEVGATVSNPAFTASYSFLPASAYITNTDNINSPFNLTTPFTAGTITGSFAHNTNTSTTFTLSAVTASSVKTATQSINFYPRTFTGVGAAGATGATASGNNATLTGASGTLTGASTFGGIFSSIAGQSFGTLNPSNQKIYLLTPFVSPAPTFKDQDGITFVFNAPSTITFVNQNGISLSYYLYESTNLLDTAFTITVSGSSQQSGSTSTGSILGTAIVGSTTVGEAATDWIACPANTTTTLYTLPSPTIASGEIVSMAAAIEIDNTAAAGFGHFERRICVKNISGTIQTTTSGTSDTDVTAPPSPSNISSNIFGAAGKIAISGGTLAVQISMPGGLVANGKANISWTRALGFIGGGGGGVTVSSVFPSGGPIAGTSGLYTIIGTGFTGGTMPVTFNGVSQSGTVINSTTIMCPLPSTGSASTGVVQVNGVGSVVFDYVAGMASWMLANDQTASTTTTNRVSGGLTYTSGAGGFAYPTLLSSDLNGYKAYSFAGPATNTNQLTSTNTLAVANSDTFFVIKATTWTLNAGIAGSNIGAPSVFGYNSSSPGFGNYCGASWAGNDQDLPLSTYGIVRHNVNSGTNAIQVGTHSPQSFGGGPNNIAGTRYLGAFNGSSYAAFNLFAELIFDTTATGYSAAQNLAWLRRDTGL